MSDASTPPKSLLGRLIVRLWNAIVWAYRLVVIALVLLFIAGLILGSRNAVPKVEDNIALVLAPSGSLVEQSDLKPAQRIAEEFNGEPPSQTVLRDLIEALDAAATDSRIPLAVLKLDLLSDAGLAQIQELTAAIDRFKTSGKPVYAYGEAFTQTGYLIAAHADEIVLDPLGLLLIDGLSRYGNYFKDALDKLGITINVFRVGEYKSAVEPFLRNDMSPEAREADRQWLGDLWGGYTAEVAAARKLPAGRVDDYVNGFAAGMQRLKGDAAAYAKEQGLITSIATLSEFRAHVGGRVGMDDDLGSFRQIYFGDYLHAVRHGKPRPREAESRIALVVVQGEIMDGDSQPGQAGGDTIADLLDEARRDDGVAAVVLRVDSPGGSVTASERIRRAVQALRKEGKPVVASMSTLAASGGYWVSMSADKIIAQPSTITGSIGIFGLIPTLEGPLNKLGIHTDGVGTTSLAGSLRIDRPLSPAVKTIIQATIERGYREFIGGVAEGRSLDVGAVDAMARGHVWSGARAKALKLIDGFGGLDEAVKTAAGLAQLTEGSYALDEFRPEDPMPLQALAQFFGSALSQVGLNQSLGAELAKALRSGTLTTPLAAVLPPWLNDPQHAYVHCQCAVSLPNAMASAAAGSGVGDYRHR